MKLKRINAGAALRGNRIHTLQSDVKAVATVLPVGAPDFCVAVVNAGHVRFSCRLVSRRIPFPRNFYRDRPTKAKQNWSKSKKL